MSAAEAKEFVSEVWGLQGTAYLVVALRYYARVSKSGWKSLAWDDGLMLLATFVYTAESVAAYMVVAYWQGFANNGMTDQERAALDPNSTEWTLRVNGSKTHVVGLLLYLTLLWILKACWIVYYARLTEGVASRRRLVMIGSFIMPITYVSCLLVAFLKCVPFDHQWQINPNPGNNCLPAVSILQTIYVMIMNTVTDIYLMMIPIPMIWNSQLRWKSKVSIIILFSGGFVEMIFGVLRAVSILTLGNTDPAQSGFWSVRESFVSFVLTNLPFIYPLIRGVVDKTRASTSKSKDRTGALSTGKNGYRLDSFHTPKPRQTDADSKKYLVPQHDAKPVAPEAGERVSLDEASSQDSYSMVHNAQRRMRTVQSMSGPGVSAQVSAVRGPAPADTEPGQGILVTRAYEWTVTER
ncbi:hypothetical protein N0V93_002015 [Gnomoniopsis smithogilvyi]|uniref:Rhodopsin domain-containing protein n=1 Tax=Gnomoniopsis smithogilvyi TaxID=1191159 RepID=A0A9W8Z520_9PEZI|nr:hypothetical protein N0V93_002015 [Gnomoniopsis smithogilvyi]